MDTNYVPFGKEWEKEMMKLNKKELIEIVRKVSIELQNAKKPIIWI